MRFDISCLGKFDPSRTLAARQRRSVPNTKLAQGKSDERHVIAVPDRERAEVVGNRVVRVGAPDPGDAVARLSVTAGGRETPGRQGEEVVVRVRLPSRCRGATL
jgi:hypothetical protein